MGEIYVHANLIAVWADTRMQMSSTSCKTRLEKDAILGFLELKMGNLNSCVFSSIWDEHNF